MMKKVIIFLFILPFILFVVVTTIFVYSQQTQNFIINSFNLKGVLNKKVKSFISRKINDENIIIEINSIKILKPNRTNILRIQLTDTKVHTIGQKEKSNVKFIELGFSYEILLRNIFYNRDNIEFSYLNFKDLTLYGQLVKNNFIPGPLFKIFSLINKKSFEEQHSLQKLLQNQIVIGNISLFISDQRVSKERSILNVNCKNVVVSKYLNNARSLNMNCNKNKKNTFSIKADLFENFNEFNVNIQNIDPKLFLGNLLPQNLKFKQENISGFLKGNIIIVTDKNFNLESLNFLSNKSNLFFKNNDEIILDAELSGKILWNKKDDLLKINDLSIGDIIIPYAEMDLYSKTGFSNFVIKELSTREFKFHLSSYESYYNTFFNLNVLKKYYENFKGGNLKNINLDLKFSFSNRINIKKISGRSDFSNIKFGHNDKIFKKVFCTISGNFKFEVKKYNNEIIIDQSWASINLDASKGFTSLRKNNLNYKFDNAKIILKIHKNNFIISKADFLKNNLKYSFNDVKIQKNYYRISKAMFFRDNKLQYALEDTTINNQIITKSLLKVKYNSELSEYLIENLNIEINSDVEFNFILTGNITSLDLSLKLHSDLTDLDFKINYLNLMKKKNIISSIKTEFIYHKGELALIKDIFLKIEKNNYKISLVKLNDKSSAMLLLKDIKTPKLDLKKISIFKKEKKFNLNFSGKKIDFSYLKKNLQKQSKKNININFDMTADEIILDPKISLEGSLRGTINNSIFDATAFGRMWLDKSPLLDSGKYKIYIDDKMSKLTGFGLIGGAETKIIMEKSKDNFPKISFDTSDGGKLLNALGFTKNIRSGDMRMNINFLNDKYDHYKGVIKSKKFSIINTPQIINSLSVLSFSGIQSVISGEGVYFDKGKANINLKKNELVFDKVYLSSQSLGITAKGKINLKDRILEMKGSVAPIKLISQIISVVPAVGTLITGLKKEGLFAGQFKMVGPIENPKVKLNTLSFAPGILRDLFADDWLDNNNFFLNDGSN